MTEFKIRWAPEGSTGHSSADDSWVKYPEDMEVPFPIPHQKHHFLLLPYLPDVLYSLALFKPREVPLPEYHDNNRTGLRCACDGI